MTLAVLAALLLGAAADARPETFLVLPFDVKGDAPAWAGAAAAEALTDAVAQSGKDNFITPKQLDAVLRRRDLTLSDKGVAEQADALARALGATRVVAGEVAQSAGQVTITARLLQPGAAQALKTATSEGAAEKLPQALGAAAQQLFGEKWTPFTRDTHALGLGTKCALQLDRQSLSPRAKVVLDTEAQAALAEACREALRADKEFGLPRAGLAVALALQGKPAEAKKEAQAAQKLRFVPLAVLADAFATRQAEGDKAANAVLEKAVAEHPGFLHALGYVLEERHEANDNAAALWLAERYLARAPDQPWALAQRSQALAKLGRKEEALVAGKRTLEVSPNDPEMQIELASRYIDLGRDADAMPLLLQATQANPPRPLAYLRLGWIHLRAGKLKQSREQFTKALTLATRPDESRWRALAYGDLAQVAAREGLYDNAVEALVAARREGLKNPPCAAPEFAAFKGRPELVAACSGKQVESLDDSELARVDLQ